MKNWCDQLDIVQMFLLHLENDFYEVVEVCYCWEGFLLWNEWDGKKIDEITIFIGFCWMYSAIFNFHKRNQGIYWLKVKNMIGKIAHFYESNSKNCLLIRALENEYLKRSALWAFFHWKISKLSNLSIFPNGKKKKHFLNNSIYHFSRILKIGFLKISKMKDCSNKFFVRNGEKVLENRTEVCRNPDIFDFRSINVFRIWLYSISNLKNVEITLKFVG